MPQPSTCRPTTLAVIAPTRFHSEGVSAALTRETLAVLGGGPPGPASRGVLGGGPPGPASRGVLGGGPPGPASRGVLGGRPPRPALRKLMLASLDYLQFSRNNFIAAVAFF